MKRVLIILCSFNILIFACLEKNNDTCISKITDIDWQFYMYNVYYNASKIPVLDDTGMRVVDSISIHSSTFRRTSYPVYEDSNRVDIVFTPADTLKEYIIAYVNTLRKVKGGDIDYVFTGDRFGYSIDSIDVSDVNRKFKEYLIKNDEELLPCLRAEAVQRGFLNQ